MYGSRVLLEELGDRESVSQVHVCTNKGYGET